MEHRWDASFAGHSEHRREQTVIRISGWWSHLKCGAEQRLKIADLNSIVWIRCVTFGGDHAIQTIENSHGGFLHSDIAILKCTATMSFCSEFHPVTLTLGL